MLAQEFNGRGRILDRFCKVEALIKLKCLLPFRFGLIGQFNSRLLPPKQIRTDGDKSVRGIPITNLPHVGVDAKDFLQHDNARAITAGGQREITVELTFIERRRLKCAQ